MKTRKCGACNGRGFTMVTYDNRGLLHGIDMSPPKTLRVTCGKCGGKGVR